MIRPAPSIMRKISQRRRTITTGDGGVEAGKGPRRQSGARKIARKPDFQQQDVPAVAVEDLAHVGERHVEHPERGQDGYVREAEEDEQGEAETDGGGDLEGQVGAREPEEGGQLQERAEAGAVGVRHRLQEGRRGQEPVAAQERPPLAHDHQEGDGVDEAEQAQDGEAREPVRGALGQRRCLAAHGSG